MIYMELSVKNIVYIPLFLTYYGGPDHGVDALYLFDYFTIASIYHFHVSFCVGNFGRSVSADSNLLRIFKLNHLEIVLHLQISEIAATVNNNTCFNSTTELYRQMFL